MFRPWSRAVALLTSLAVATPALAWGPQGHRVIARAAEDRLSPAAKAAIRDLLHEGDTLSDIANWADHEAHTEFRESAPWHFINVPISRPRFEARDIRDDRNVVVKVKQYRKLLADKNQPKTERQKALLFLVHFIADLHQPLHVGDNDDQGGNRIQVQFLGQPTNLHKVWDSDLIRHVGGNDRAWVARIERASTPEAVKAWSRGTFDDWTDGTLQAAKLAYVDPETSPRPIATGATLGPGYARRAEPILIDQMARASIRLADELNAIFR